MESGETDQEKPSSEGKLYHVKGKPIGSWETEPNLLEGYWTFLVGCQEAAKEARVWGKKTFIIDTIRIRKKNKSPENWDPVSVL